MVVFLSEGTERQARQAWELRHEQKQTWATIARRLGCTPEQAQRAANRWAVASTKALLDLRQARRTVRYGR